MCVLEKKAAGAGKRLNLRHFSKKGKSAREKRKKAILEGGELLFARGGRNLRCSPYCCQMPIGLGQKNCLEKGSVQGRLSVALITCRKREGGGQRAAQTLLGAQPKRSR